MIQFSSRSILIAMLLVLATSAVASANESTTQNWWYGSPWKEPDRGYNWYPDPIQPKVEEKREAATPPKQPKITEMTDLEEINKELKRLKQVAIINPTDANVHEFLQAQSWLMDKSSVFADVARRVVWANPDVNYNNRSPVANFSRLKDGERRSAETKSTIKNLSAENGLLFFARSDCPYCHDQAPVLKEFARSTGMDVIAISLDGGPIPLFPDAKRDNGISMRVSEGQGIAIVPAIYLVNRRTMEATALGTGVIASDEIAERVRVLTNTKPGQEF